MTNEPRHQADGHGQLQDAAEWASPFARPSLWAGASTMPPAHLRDPVAGLVQPKDSLTT